MSFSHPTLQQFFNARGVIKPFIRETPLLHSAALSHVCHHPFYLKCDMLQPTGAFKVRGAAHKILNLPSEVQSRGVVAVSTGNHGCAVAYIAQQLGIKAYVYMSENVPQNKLKNIQYYGADIVIVGQSQDEAEVAAREFAQQKGLALIHPFDDMDIILGQGTITLELIEQLPSLRNILVPLSGGGLISGIACAAKHFNPDIQIIGISMENGAAMHQSLKAHKPIEVPEAKSFADSLQGGIGLTNQYTFEMTRHYVDHTVLITEDDIFKGIAYMLKQHKFLLEGAAVVGIAALLAQKLPTLTGSTACILTGQNVDPSILGLLAKKHFIH